MHFTGIDIKFFNFVWICEKKFHLVTPGQLKKGNPVLLIPVIFVLGGSTLVLAAANLILANFLE